MNSLSFVGSCNFRSYFYLSALKKKQLKLANVHIYDYKKLDISPFKNKKLRYKDFEFIFDESLDDLLDFFDAKIVDKSSINELEDEIKSINSDICIFSGNGGEIVNEKILKLNKFLHIHPGKLPSFRGSTTIYFSLLKENACYASAFFLDSKIDTGKIIKEMKFDILDIDFDYLYDPLIRTYLLIYIVKNQIFIAKEQLCDNQKEYYIIHPVLKKLALLKKKTIINDKIIKSLEKK